MGVKWYVQLSKCSSFIPRNRQTLAQKDDILWEKSYPDDMRKLDTRDEGHSLSLSLSLAQFNQNGFVHFLFAK